MQRPRRRRKPPPYGTPPDPYTPASWRGALLMAVVCLVAIVLIWLAYGWALGEMDRVGIPVPSGLSGI